MRADERRHAAGNCLPKPLKEFKKLRSLLRETSKDSVRQQVTEWGSEEEEQRLFSMLQELESKEMVGLQASKEPSHHAFSSFFKV